MNIRAQLLLLISLPLLVYGNEKDSNCSSTVSNEKRIGKNLKALQIFMPKMDNTTKGDMGKILIVGGSIEYSGAPYFAAISALKVGSDLVFVLTTAEAAPIIKSYSPELIVYPHLLGEDNDIIHVLRKADVIVIGPGLGKSDEAFKAFKFIIKTAKVLKKPLVVDADGLFFISKCKDEFVNYPGAILTPNHVEVAYLKNDTDQYDFGDKVAVLEKGKEDRFYSTHAEFNWRNSEGGSVRRTAGQGDILAGALGTIYGWVLKSECRLTEEHAHSVAAYIAAAVARGCNQLAFQIYGRSMTASDMIAEIHNLKM